MLEHDATTPGAGRLAVTIAMALLVSVPAWGIGPSALGQSPPAPPDLPVDPAQTLPSDGVIQPGDPVTADPLGLDPGGCTLSYVLDGSEATYIALPGQCVEVGDTVSTVGFPGFGGVVHESSSIDLALVEVAPEHEGDVEATVENRPGAPTGVTSPHGALSGDPLLTPEGTGMLARQGETTADVLAVGDAQPAGTPLVHAATGRLVGHVSQTGVCVTVPTPSYGCGIPPVRSSGPTVAHALDTLASEGLEVSLRTVDAEPGPQQALAEAATPATRTALDQDGVIQPGDALQTLGGAKICTYNFVFDGPEAVYIGTAAHCVSQGQRVGTPAFPDMGEVVHDGGGADVALVRIDDRFTEHVLASVKGHPATPTGVAEPGDTVTGDLMYVSGYGTGFRHDDTTRENRWGLLFTQGDRGYTALGAFSPGDSGGPVVHGPSGDALGVAAYIGVCAGLCEPVRVGGPTIDVMLDVLHQHGFDVTLRTADGGLGLEQAASQAAATVTRLPSSTA